MIPHPPSDPAAEAVSALRQRIREALYDHWPYGMPSLYAGMADTLIAGPLAPILTDNAALRTRAEEAEREVVGLKAERLKLDKRIHCQRISLRQNWEIVEMRMGVGARARLWKFARQRSLDCRSAEADRDRLATKLAEARAENKRRATDNAVLRSVLVAARYLIDRLQACHMGKRVTDLGEATEAYMNAAARALTTAKGDDDVEA